jgi:hypothetical protein
MAQSQGLPPEFRSEIKCAATQTATGIDQDRQTKSVALQAGESKPPRNVFSLDKDWHIFHYVLNGTAHGGDGPLADAVLGGREIPDVEGVMGYGPLRYLEPNQVQSVADALAGVNPTRLLSKLDLRDAQAKKIYLSHTLSNLTDWSHFPGLFEEFRAFYGDAARQGNAMLFSIM